MYKYKIYIKFSSGLAVEFTKLYKRKNIDVVASHEIRKIEKQRVFFDELQVTKLYE